jgi:hypothetical protein
MVSTITFPKENLGQVFYNSTSNAFKVTQQPVPGGTWASGGNLNTARTYLWLLVMELKRCSFRLRRIAAPL